MNETNRPKKITPDSKEFVLLSGIAGGIAGCVAKTCVAPLDRVKILYQTHHSGYIADANSRFGVVKSLCRIYKTHGVWGLFQGHTATLYRIFPYAGIKFVAYEQVRRFLIPTPSQETTVRRFLTGSLAGVASVLFTYPLELIRVRLAFFTESGRRPRFTDTIRLIYKENARRNILAGKFQNLLGVLNFYQGFGVTLLGMFPYAGMSFLAYDTAIDFLAKPSVARYLNTTTVDSGERRLKAWAELGAGAVAGMCGQTLSYPLEVIRRKMQVAGSYQQNGLLTLRKTIMSIFRQSGLRGFYVGLTIGYAKVIPMVSISFFVYSRSKRWLRLE
ncbi:coenzyme A transporter [Schizosaccharomyces japonicus yFS275]|uniref:Coenzyme A transporter n=1 Tax=Schizosaccharomyces japonicus (strain yFS275 / FY16936) TaxID=402676 RepID=B6K499_SCHJY|nr:coenzyme A transporter [Schizosaccharomyces japonicus yFS275]EEB08306.1 coenzyme A transporter [Schizosaccharomyces japonicus yFS275]